jgi:hypothetical protein
MKALGEVQPPVIDILVVSGGGDWGAFGAGFLKGWGRVPPGPMARPQFDIVTGVSTGALIAPFAFLGTDDAIERIVQLYRYPKPDWVKQRGFLYFLPNHISFAEVPGDWAPPKPGVFVAETMNALADLGERMGADPASWRTDLP